MYRAGVPLRNMRVCEPFGRNSVRDCGFTMFWSRKPGPDVWAGVGCCQRGALCQWERCYFALRKRITKPPHHTWRSYACSCWMWCRKERQNITVIKLRLPALVSDAGLPGWHPGWTGNDLGSRDIPSWRRICKTLIKMISGVGPSPSVRTNPGTMNVSAAYERKEEGMGDSVTPEVKYWATWFDSTSVRNDLKKRPTSP